MKGHGEKLTRKKEAVIVALLLEPTLEKAAARVGISESTLWRWTQLESFQAAYREARREAVSQVIGALQRASSEAVETLRDIMKDTAAPAPAMIIDRRPGEPRGEAEARYLAANPERWGDKAPRIYLCLSRGAA